MPPELLNAIWADLQATDKVTGGSRERGSVLFLHGTHESCSPVLFEPSAYVAPTPVFLLFHLRPFPPVRVAAFLRLRACLRTCFCASLGF